MLMLMLIVNGAGVLTVRRERSQGCDSIKNNTYHGRRTLFLWLLFLEILS